MKIGITLFFSIFYIVHSGFGNPLDSLVKLDWIIQGKGVVIPNSPPPYYKGQNITLTFFPSGGAEFSTKPNVPVAAETDSLWGWVFDHWSYSESSIQEKSGLQNPFTITLNTDITLYVRFIKQGTHGHLSEKQEEQLWSLRKGMHQGWESSSQKQLEGLFEKAENYLLNFKKDNQRWGQPATVWWKDFGRKSPFGFDFLGEGTTWAGLVLQALALKHSEMPEDTTTIQDILTVLKALERNVKITGVPGRVARFSGPAQDEAYRWYYKNVKVGAHSGTDPWKGMIWLGKPTRDTHTGLFTGLSAVGYFCRDVPRLFQSAKEITEWVVDRLVLDKWKIKGLDDGYKMVNNSNLKQLQMRTAYFFNPEKYKSFKRKIENFHLSLNQGQGLYNQLYWVEWMTWSRTFGIVLLEKSKSKKREQILAVNQLYEKKKLHLNPFYVGVTAYLNSLVEDEVMEKDLEKWLQAELEGILLAYPDGIKWNREVNLFEDPRFSPYDQKHVKEAALPSQVVQADFNAQRSAARAKGGSNIQSYQLTNFDMFLAYWLGKASGRLNK